MTMSPGNCASFFQTPTWRLVGVLLSKKAIRLGALMIALTCIVSQPAICGHWEVSYELDGENNSDLSGTESWPGTMNYPAGNNIMMY